LHPTGSQDVDSIVQPVLGVYLEEGGREGGRERGREGGRIRGEARGRKRFLVIRQQSHNFRTTLSQRMGKGWGEKGGGGGREGRREGWKEGGRESLPW